MPRSVGPPTAPVLPDAKHVHTMGAVGGVPATSAAPAEVGFSVSVPFPARAVVVTVIKPLPVVIATEVMFAVATGFVHVPAATQVVAAPVR